MRALRVALLVAAAMIVVGPVTASACDVSGTFVCARDQSIVVANKPISFTLVESMWANTPASLTVYTDGSGVLPATHVDWESTWNVAYYGTLYCGAGEGANPGMGVVLVPDSNPACTPPVTCPVSLPSTPTFCPSRPIGNPRAECELFGLAVLDKNDGTSGQSWLATTDARIALVKAGGCYKYFVDVKAGDVLGSPNGQGISHVTYCGCP